MLTMVAVRGGFAWAVCHASEFSGKRGKDADVPLFKTVLLCLDMMIGSLFPQWRSEGRYTYT